MTTNPETPDVEDANVEEPVSKPEKATRQRTPEQKAARKRRDAAAKKQRSEQAAEPVVEKKSVESDPTPEELAEEIKDNITESKDQFVEATLEPARKAATTLVAVAEYAREGFAGWFDGLLRKKRDRD